MDFLVSAFWAAVVIMLGFLTMVNLFYAFLYKPTHPCPVCQLSLTEGTPVCPSCGAVLKWTWFS